MQSVADLKRAMTTGTVVEVVNFRHPSLSGTRTVLKAQTKRWCLSFPASHPKAGKKYEGSWLDIPRASLVEFDGNTATIWHESEGKDAAPFCSITIH